MIVPYADRAVLTHYAVTTIAPKDGWISRNLTMNFIINDDGANQSFAHRIMRRRLDCGRASCL
jgi:hypothetical protein